MWERPQREPGLRLGGRGHQAEELRAEVSGVGSLRRWRRVRMIALCKITCGSVSDEM